MRKLIVLVALSLGALSARAQAVTGATVTKLPGEEKLSVRERAERDFLMPVRRKKAAELAKQPTASAAELTTAAPENDALTSYNEAAPDPRPEAEAAESRAAGTTRSRAARHAAWVAARRERLAEARAAERRAEARAEAKAEARRAARHSSSKSKAAKTKHASKATKAAASKSSKSKSVKAKRHVEETHHSKKTTAHKATKSHKVESTKTKRHTAAAKTKTKTKARKRR